MPKSVGEEDVKPKRVTRKRVAKTAVKKTAAKKPRKTAVKKTPPKAVEEISEVADEATDTVTKNRKAPTVFSDQKKARRKFQINAVVVGIILLFGIGGSAVIGFTDEGQIDVNQVIEARNERVKNNLTDGRDVVANTVTVPVQNTNNGNQVDGGLVGLGDRNPPTPAAATSTATSSTESVNASSSEAVASSSQPVTQVQTDTATTSETETIE